MKCVTCRRLIWMQLEKIFFFFPTGHISPLLYSVLARSGYFDSKELASFRKINSRLQGHPTTHEHLPGIRIASGSLGQGLSVAIGAAITKKRNHDACLVYSLHGDGELQKARYGKPPCLHRIIRSIT